MKHLKFGCFGDDFTGSSDAASFIKKAGMKTVLVKGIPTSDFILPEDTDAVVIALKIRTIPKEQAVKEALAAYTWLQTQGTEHIYYKYCSTFDSTDQGNIGPIVDAILEKYKLNNTALIPALPINGRTVKAGKIYVFGIPLDETHMRNHPLTPMLSASIPVLMSKQGKYRCLLLTSKDMELEKANFAKRITDIAHDHCYFVPDYENDFDATLIANCFSAWPFLTGGSGILTALCKKYVSGKAKKEKAKKIKLAGKALLLAGSCSAITLQQIKRYHEAGGKIIKVLPESLFTNEKNSVMQDIQPIFTQLWEKIKKENTENKILIYSSSVPNQVKAIQDKYGKEAVSARLEKLMSLLAVEAVKSGWEKIIVAGGETSGAVTEALQSQAYRIGTEIAPGVPVLEPLNTDNLQLVLKSGNFGSEDFFNKALQIMDERDGNND